MQHRKNKNKNKTDPVSNKMGSEDRHASALTQGTSIHKHTNKCNIRINKQGGLTCTLNVWKN